MTETKNPPLLSIGPRVRKSPFFDATLRYGATAFTIYNHTFLPASYGDNVRDYWSLVNDVTLWDVACQRQVEIAGPDAFEFVQFLTPRDMSKCAVGQCQYLPLTNQDGGIVNDAVLLRIEENLFWLSPGDGDVLWWAMGIAVNSGLDVHVREPDVSPLQLQGPKSPLVARDLFGDWPVHMKYYWLQETDLDGIPLVVSRTGWSGELGYELYLRDSRYGDELWERVIAAGQSYGIRPAAPSTIRSIEGGLLSYVSDITLEDSPYVIGMDRFVDFDQAGDFIGKAALQKIANEGPSRRLVGIEIDGPPLEVPNEEFWDVTVDGEKIGHVTRCAHSPRLDRNIGWANVPAALASIGTELVADSPAGDRRAVVCEAPWFRPQVKIPDEMKA
ncbi:MAG: glycine cleavage system protein T [Woeseiaceae bacterium]|nr:glycine cleavage system protein T [Woeseiaceae bacterium]NIP21115.1 glycine cleavage system protein T [Woeseiaceae bacterium]NIS90087.1 glycine cleavage system protein T [Woeseiaceae bacterium]